MSKAKPIPDSMRAITPHLICADGGVEESRLLDEKNKLMHAMIRIGDSAAMNTSYA